MKLTIIALGVAAYLSGRALVWLADWNAKRKIRPYKPRIYVHRGPMDAAKDRGLELFRKLNGQDGRTR